MTGPRHWTEEEMEHLLDLAGDYHLTEVCRYYNKWAASKNYPARSRIALKSKLTKSGFSIKPEGKWISLMYASETLGRSHQTVRNWIRKGWIKPDHVRLPTPRCTLIHRRAFDNLAIEKPEIFAGCSIDSLLAVFHSEVVAEEIHEIASEKFCSTHPKPVECISTGKKYPSIVAAARETYLSANAITRAVKLGSNTSLGKWKIVTQKVY